MSEIYVFLGPTLAEKEARAELDAVYLPPVSAGDVYRLWRRRPRAIGIVDGYFDRVPAPVRGDGEHPQHAPCRTRSGNRLCRHARHPSGRRNDALLPQADLAGAA